MTKQRPDATAIATATTKRSDRPQATVRTSRPTTQSPPVAVTSRQINSDVNPQSVAVRKQATASAESAPKLNAPTPARSGEAFQRWRIPLDTIDFSGEVLLPMSPGDAAFFTNYTWHRSEPNNSGVHKCAYAIAYQLRKD